MDQADLADYSLSPLHVFFAKVAIVTAAVLIVIYSSFSAASSFAAAQSQRFEAFKGGPAFWGGLENKLYALADAPDMAPEKKEKIIEAIHRLSIRYRPYLDAISDTTPADKTKREQAK